MVSETLRTDLPPARIFCIGRNYAEHVRELSNVIPERPVIFMKPASSLVRPGQAIHYPAHGAELHHEVEVVVQIGKQGKPRNLEESHSFVSGLALGLDLTLRDLQRELKQKGLPWEAAKAFDQSAPLGDLVRYDGSLDLTAIQFSCTVNGEMRQQGNTKDMIFSVETLIVELSRIWALRPGDLVFTGTPAGVGPLLLGDHVEVESPQLGSFSWNIVE